MARTKRAVQYRHYWNTTKQDLRRWIDEYPDYPWTDSYKAQLERDYLLFGTDARNRNPSTHYYCNKAHRVGRRIKRDQLRPHKVLDENFEFDDSRYRALYKGIWWEIY